MIKMKKYKFVKQKLRFLNYIISKNNIKIDLKKIAKMLFYYF